MIEYEITDSGTEFIAYANVEVLLYTWYKSLLHLALTFEHKLMDYKQLVAA